MKLVTVKEIAQLIKTGKTPPSKETKYFDGDVKWYTPGDLDKTKILQSSNRTLTQCAIQENKAITYSPGTLLVGCIGDIGKLGITKDVSSSNQQITGIYPKNNTDVNYLYYWFLGNKKIVEQYANNAVVPILNNRTLETIKIPLPPLSTQKKIAAILDEADKLRQLNRQLIDKYNALTQSLFLDMFGDPVTNPKGWDVKKGEEFCEKISVGVVIKPASYYVEEGIIALRSLNIKPNGFDMTNLVYFSKESNENQLAKSILKAGDLVIVRTGLTGTAAIIPKELNGCNCIDLIIAQPNEKLLQSFYLTYFLNSQRGKEMILGKNVGGIQKHFNVGAMKSFLIPLPPISLQNQFADRVKAIEKQKEQAQKGLEKAEELFNSLLQKAFKGELGD